MASSFEIFEDRENLKDKKFSSYGDIKRDRVMLGPLTNKAIGNENPTDQVRRKNIFFLPLITIFLSSLNFFLKNAFISSQLANKTIKSPTDSVAASRAFKDKNVFTKHDGKIKLKESSVDEEEEAETTGLWTSSESTVDSFT